MAQAAERVDPKTRRVQPGQAGNLRNARADRRYLLANPNDDLFGLAVHLDSGWTKITKSDGERVIGGRVEQNGDVTFQGQVLIWLSAEEYAAREADKRALMQAREAKRASPGGEFGLRDAQGNLPKEGSHAEDA